MNRSLQAVLSASILLAASLAHADASQPPFAVEYISAQTPMNPCQGLPITTDGVLYQHAIGNTNGGPLAQLIELAEAGEPGLENIAFDSYFAMDVKPSDAEHTAAKKDSSACGGWGFFPREDPENELRFDACKNPNHGGVESQPRNIGGAIHHAMFFSRLTRQGGTGVSVPSMSVLFLDANVRDGYFVLDLALGGEPVTGPDRAQYTIMEDISYSPVGTVHDLYIVRVPALDPCPTDLDKDGMVGSEDLDIMLNSFGADDGGDLDLDGDTDAADLNELLGAFGETCA